MNDRDVVGGVDSEHGRGVRTRLALDRDLDAHRAFDHVVLVSTSPDEVMMSPVPAAAAEPLAVWITVLMSTTAGETFRVMPLMSRLVLPEVLCWIGETVCTCACVV